MPDCFALFLKIENWICSQELFPNWASLKTKQGLSQLINLNEITNQKHITQSWFNYYILFT